MQHSLFRLGQARCSLRATNARAGLFPFSHAFNHVSTPDTSFPRNYTAFPGCLDLRGSSNHVASVACSGPPFLQYLGNLRMGMGLMNVKGSVAPSPFPSSYRSFINPAEGETDAQPGRRRSMEFVTGLSEENQKDMARPAAVVDNDVQFGRRRSMEFVTGLSEENRKDMAHPAAVVDNDVQYGRSLRIENDVQSGRSSRSMDYVRGILEENEKGMVGGSFGYNGAEHNPDIVHIKMIRNNTFVTVTDSKGNKKMGASMGCLPDMKGGAKNARYAAEATAEHVGRLSRNLGLKSVVMKVNGYMYFKKKKLAIMSWREGYTYSRGDLNPIVYIEDTTRRAHNGCRLRKQRRT